jgi:dephospho-CoA kinase
MVVGLTGPNAAGKGEVAVYLRTLGFAVHSLSDIVREEAAARGLPPGREQLIRTGNELRRTGGPGILAERILSRLEDRDVVDSIRNPAEVAVLRSIRGFLLLGVDAPARMRFERSLSRSRPGDPATFEAFEERERQENSRDPAEQQLRATFLLADRIVRNEGTLAALKAEVNRALAPDRLL